MKKLGIFKKNAFNLDLKMRKEDRMSKTMYFLHLHTFSMGFLLLKRHTFTYLDFICFYYIYV